MPPLYENCYIVMKTGHVLRTCPVLENRTAGHPIDHIQTFHHVELTSLICFIYICSPV